MFGVVVVDVNVVLEAFVACIFILRVFDTFLGYHGGRTTTGVPGVLRVGEACYLAVPVQLGRGSPLHLYHQGDAHHSAGGNQPVHPPHGRGES